MSTTAEPVTTALPLTCLNDEEKIKSFALDRMITLEVTRKKVFKNQPFDVQEYYKHCFGIMSPNEASPSEIILSFSVHQGNYIKSLPLHASQEILVDNDKELRIKLTLFILKKQKVPRSHIHRG